MLSQERDIMTRKLQKIYELSKAEVNESNEISFEKKINNIQRLNVKNSG